MYVQFSNVDTRGHELASFLDGRLDELDLMGRYSKIVCNEELPLCPKLTHLSLRVIDLCDAVEGLSRAIQNTRFPCLSHVSLIDCSSTQDGALSRLFQTQCPTLVHLNLDDFEIDKKDLEFLSSVNVDPIQSPLPNLSVLICSARSFSHEASRLQSLFRKSWNQLKGFTLRYGRCPISNSLIHVINEGKLPNLSELHMSLMWGERVDVGLFAPDKVPRLESLTLEGFVNSESDLDLLNEKVRHWRLKKLDITRSSGVSGNLYVLLLHSLSSLKTLIVKHCELDSEDLRGLARANAQGYLPELELLDISENGLSKHLEYLYRDPDTQQEVTWKNVNHLDFGE